MAERAAHLTQTLQAKPSIFEVIAADSLQATFNPAIKRLCTSLATGNPEKLGWLIRYYDEFYLILNAIVQQHYIRTYGGTISEVFYSLTRVLYNSDTLSKHAKYLILICTVMLPYIRIKIEKLLAKCKLQIEENPKQVKYLDYKQQLIQSYQLITTIYECVQIYQYIAYMANTTKSHSLLLRLMQMNLTYLPPDSEEDNWTWSDFFRGNVRLTSTFTTLIFRGLELSAFFLQFIQWWQNETSNGNLTNLPAPNAPNPDVNSKKYLLKCPICLQNWNIPTVISISGYVYCYTCIMKHFEISQTCPVTNYPASIEDLVRTYDD